MVGYDSIIPPGRTGSIKPQVNIKNMHGGSFSKTIRVTSNDPEKENFVLVIKGTIKPIIGYSNRYVQLNHNDKDPFTLELQTEKKNLKIKEIVFEPHERKSSQGPAWQSSLPIFVDFECTRVNDEPGEDGLYTYSLLMQSPRAVEERKRGKFIVKTNHPEKREFELRGSIE